MLSQGLLYLEPPPRVVTYRTPRTNIKQKAEIAMPSHRYRNHRHHRGVQDIAYCVDLALGRLQTQGLCIRYHQQAIGAQGVEQVSA